MHSRSSTYLGLGLVVALSLLIWGCPRGTKLPERSAVGGLLEYNYAGVSVMHQYSDRDYVHIRLHFGWQRPEENSYAAQTLAVQAAFTCGAGDNGPSAFAGKLEATGAVIDVGVGPDGPVVTVDCLPERLDQTWELMSTCLTDPQFERNAFQDLRATAIAKQKTSERTPKEQAMSAACAQAWPTDIFPGETTVEELEAVALTTAQATFRDIMRLRCNLRLVTIGPVDAEHVSELLSVTVEGLPEGVCAEPPAIKDPPILNDARLVQASSKSEAFVAIFPGPSPTSLQAVPMRLVMRMLEKRLRDQLVEHDRVAEMVQAWYPGLEPGYNLIQVTGTNAFQCAEFTLSQLRKLKAAGFGEAEVERGRRAVLAEIALSYESAPALAGRLDQAASHGILTLTGHERDILEAADPKGLASLLRTYLTGISWGIVGDTAGIDRKSLQRL